MNDTAAETTTLDDDECALVPIRNGAGDVVAVAKVEPRDFERINRYRWTMCTAGYPMRSRSLGGGRHYTETMGRTVLGLVPGGPKVFHINGDGLDCRRSNLRLPVAWLGARVADDAHLTDVVLRATGVVSRAA